MFRCQRNDSIRGTSLAVPAQSQKPTSKADILDVLERELGERFPPSWRWEVNRRPRGRPEQADAVLRITGPDGTVATLLIEAKQTLNPRDIPGVLGQAANAAAGSPELFAGSAPVIVARYLNPRAREILTEQGASYADATGNLLLRVDRPAVFLEGVGASADPWRGPERETRSLKGRPAARVVRALVDFRPPYGVRELADRSGASLGSTYRSVDFLDKEALIRRDGKGTIVDVDWPALLRRWSEDYSFKSSSPLVISGFEPRGPREVLERLRSTSARNAVTGSLSSARVAPVADTALAMVFAAEPRVLAEAISLRNIGPTNVMIARPYDDVAFARASEEDGVSFVAWSQTAVDLLSAGGRGPAEGEALIEWMQGNEDDWRK